MLLPPDRDTERRSLIWSRFAEPLMDFVFDEVTLESDYQRIGRCAVESDYTNDELTAIYWHEVFPAIAGSWNSIDPLDPTWLEQRIRNKPAIGYLFTFLIRPWWIWLGWDCWRKIKSEIEFERGKTRAEINSKGQCQ